MTVDDRWYRGAGMRASVSHRVIFDRAPVLARFGGPGALAQQPWFGRDALRTAASWAGMADCAVDGALEAMAERPACGPLEELATGRMLTAQETITAWLERAARAMDAASEDLADVALHARAAIAQSARTILAEAERACGSHPFATGGRLDRARRDLELFLLQHRLDPALAAAGARALASDRSATVTAVDHFEAEYRADPDPWRYRSSAYEQAKYAATLAACGPGPFDERAGAGRLDRRVQRAAGAALPAADHHRLLAHRGAPGPCRARALTARRARCWAPSPTISRTAALTWWWRQRRSTTSTPPRWRGRWRSWRRGRCPGRGWSACTGGRPGPSGR